MQIEASSLRSPISDDHACGEDLDDTQLLASFEAYRLFGQIAPWEAGKEPDWRDIRDRSVTALQASRDLRILAHLAAAVLRTDGLAPFAEVLKAAASWVETWWDEVYPRVDEDAILRRNALNALADRIAVVDGLRRVPILVHRQLGTFSIRDMEIALGQLAPASEEAPRSRSELDAMLAAADGDGLRELETQLREASESLGAIERTMRDRGGSESVPEFGPLTGILARTRTVLAPRLSAAAPAAAGGEGSDTVPRLHGGSPAISGAISSRDDAVRALDAVAAFFRSSEPSSPVPLFLERAKRLIAKDFLAVLEDIAPDALPQAKHAGGIRDAE